jgi:uncharacterized protein
MLKRFAPNLLVASVRDIPLADLAARGIRGILFDLDNTLLAHRHAPQFDPTVVQWLADARAQQFQICIVSNGRHARTMGLAEQLDVPAVAQSGKPRRRGLRRALELLQLEPAAAAMVGDQLFTDVWAGNRLGLYTILVEPYHPEEPWVVRVKRPLERIVLQQLGAKVKGGPDAEA